jgi:predicted transposase YbfD/YdcC
MDNTHCSTLLEHLEHVPDPRSRHGQRFAWRMLLALLNAGLASGQKTPRAIADWVKEHAVELLAALQPAKARLPSATTLWRVLKEVDEAAVEAQVACHNQALDADDTPASQVRAANGTGLQGQSVDGKELRGSTAHGEPHCLVSLVRHGSAYTLGQEDVPGKGHEIQAVQRLLADRDLSGTVTTMDALLTQRSIAELIIRQHGHYLMVVKPNQPELYKAIALLFESPPVPLVPGEVLDYTYPGKEHGRLETRSLACSPALATYAYLKWPGLAQVMRRTCQRINLRTGQVEHQTRYGLTSLDRTLAGPRLIEHFWRQHWTIENGSHYVRDETLGEDRSQVHIDGAPRVMAALRNGLIALLRHHGWSNIAAALRHYGASPQRALQLIGWTET